MSGRVFLGLTSSNQALRCLARGHNAVTPARLEPVFHRSPIKHFTTEPLYSLNFYLRLVKIQGDSMLIYQNARKTLPDCKGLMTEFLCYSVVRNLNAGVHKT